MAKYKKIEKRLEKHKYLLYNLEKYDEEIMNTRDSSKFRHKGKAGTSIKTKTGLIEYKRV